MNPKSYLIIFNIGCTFITRKLTKLIILRIQYLDDKTTYLYIDLKPIQSKQILNTFYFY